MFSTRTLLPGVAAAAGAKFDAKRTVARIPATSRRPIVTLTIAGENRGRWKARRRYGNAAACDKARLSRLQTRAKSDETRRRCSLCAIWFCDAPSCRGYACRERSPGLHLLSPANAGESWTDPGGERSGREGAPKLFTVAAGFLYIRAEAPASLGEARGVSWTTKKRTAAGGGKNGTSMQRSAVRIYWQRALFAARLNVLLIACSRLEQSLCSSLPTSPAYAVPRTASDEDIKRAYRHLAQTYHPDKHRTAGMREVKFAWPVFTVEFHFE